MIGAGSVRVGPWLEQSLQRPCAQQALPFRLAHRQAENAAGAPPTYQRLGPPAMFDPSLERGGHAGFGRVAGLRRRGLAEGMRAKAARAVLNSGDHEQLS